MRAGLVGNRVGTGFRAGALNALRPAGVVRATWQRMQGKWVQWALVATGLAATSCAGVVGAGAVVVVAGAGVLAFTCYDRVSVTVTDRVTGRQLCDAKVRFFDGDSAVEATNCYQAALSAGKYRLHVERPGLLPFDEPIEVSKGGNCGQTVQTMYVALERVEQAPSVAAPPTLVLPPVNGTVVKATPGVVTAPSAAVVPSTTPPAAPAPPSAPAATPGASVPPPPAPSGAATFPPEAPAPKR